MDTASLILVQLADPQDQCCNGKSQGWQDHPEESDREDAKNHGNDPLLIVPDFLVGTDILPLVSIGPWIPIGIPVEIPIGIPVEVPIGISIKISEIIIHKILSYPDLS